MPDLIGHLSPHPASQQTRLQKNSTRDPSMRKRGNDLTENDRFPLRVYSQNGAE